MRDVTILNTVTINSEKKYSFNNLNKISQELFSLSSTAAPMNKWQGLIHWYSFTMTWWHHWPLSFQPAISRVLRSSLIIMPKRGTNLIVADLQAYAKQEIRNTRDSCSVTGLITEWFLFTVVKVPVVMFPNISSFKVSTWALIFFQKYPKDAKWKLVLINILINIVD